MFIGKLSKSHCSWKENNNKKVNNDNHNNNPIKTLGTMFQDVHKSAETIVEEEIDDSYNTVCSGPQINIIAEVHKCDLMLRKGEKSYETVDVEITNDKHFNNNDLEGKIGDNQKQRINKSKKQNKKITRLFGGKECQAVKTNKDVEKAEETKADLSETPNNNDDVIREYSKCDEIRENYAKNSFKCQYQNNRPKIFETKDNLGENTDEKMKSKGIQATPFPPFRLHFLPEKDWRETESRLYKLLKLILSQCGLACIVLSWAMIGALVFRFTEGPQEQFQVEEMARKQSALVVGLATELRQVVPEEPFWRQTIENYANHHEALILSAVSSGYPQRGTIWTYPGSLLFATSLLTTLGFGAPVPRTVVGRMYAIIFAGLGIPLHLLLVLNIGLLFVVKLTRLANIFNRKLKFMKFKIHKVKSRADSEKNSAPDWPEELFVADKPTPPSWLKYFPFIAIPTYYLIGFLLFGVARGKQFPEVFIFPLDFTAAGGVASRNGILRIAYAIYLEGAVILASTNVALLRVSATRGFTNAAIQMGLMTNSLW